MGAAVGKLFGDMLGAPKRARGALIAAGAGAGLASAFNAPLAGFLFVMEEFKREMSALTYGSALIASVAAVAVTRYTVGEKPSFVLPSPGPGPLAILPAAAMLGVVAGVGGVLFNRGLLGALELRRRLKMHAATMGAIAGGLAAVALLLYPQVTGGGHPVTENLLSNKAASVSVTAILALFAAKLLLTVISYATGLPGGIFAPILVMGASLGYAFGIVVLAIWPSVPFSPEGFATIGMAAMLSASVRAPLTGVVLIVEMTAEYGLLYALIVAAFVATLVAQALRDHPIYDALMERDLRLSGAEVHPEEEPILIEVLVESHSAMDGRRIKHLGLPTGAIVFTLERGSRHIVPGGSTMLVAGDMLTIMIEGDKPELSLKVHESARAPG
jgi:CIC family chloride channel protein